MRKLPSHSQLSLCVLRLEQTASVSLLVVAEKLERTLLNWKSAVQLLAVAEKFERSILNWKSALQLLAVAEKLERSILNWKSALQLPAGLSIAKRILFSNVFWFCDLFLQAAETFRTAQS